MNKNIFLKSVLILLTLSILTQAFQMSKEKLRKIRKGENPFKHVILLGMENHSFDNMLGYMPSPIGDLNENTYCNEYKGKQYCTQPGANYSCEPDPGHSFNPTNKAIFGREDFAPGNEQEETMGWFAYNQGEQDGDPQTVMSAFTPDQVPIISTLASEFKVFTNWFSSMPGGTDPNKYFYAAASAMGNSDNCDEWFCFGYPMVAQTIFDNLLEEGFSWEIHWQDWCEVMIIEPMNREFSKFVYDQDFTNFYSQLENGTLPDYTFLVPRIYWDDIPEGETREQNTHKAPNTQHPSEDVRSGEALIKKVYETLRNSQYWEDTLLIISYDECGGFFDHVPPPKTAVNPSPETETGPKDFEWLRYGVRVPGIAISPWLAHSVDDEVIDHSSVPKTLKEIFELESDYLSERDKVMRPIITQDELLETPRQDCPTTLPEIPSFDELPIQYAKLNNDAFVGTLRTQVYKLGTMMLKDGTLSEEKYKSILEKIETNTQGKRFLKEAFEYMGYMPKSDRKFEYLSRNKQENL